MARARNRPQSGHHVEAVEPWSRADRVGLGRAVRYLLQVAVELEAVHGEGPLLGRQHSAHAVRRVWPIVRPDGMLPEVTRRTLANEEKRSALRKQVRAVGLLPEVADILRLLAQVTRDRSPKEREAARRVAAAEIEELFVQQAALRLDAGKIEAMLNAQTPAAREKRVEGADDPLLMRLQAILGKALPRLPGKDKLESHRLALWGGTRDGAIKNAVDARSVWSDYAPDMESVLHYVMKIFCPTIPERSIEKVCEAWRVVQAERVEHDRQTGRAGVSAAYEPWPQTARGGRVFVKRTRSGLRELANDRRPTDAVRPRKK